MQRANGVVLGFLLSGTAVAPVQAQTEFGTDLAVLSSYVWRGVTFTNKAVFEPALYLSIPRATLR